MAKKKIKDVEVEVKTKKVNIKAVKKDNKVDVVVDTPNIDVIVKDDGTTKEFTLDSKKLDISVIKTDEGTKVKVEAENKILEKTGNWLSKVLAKKFNKK